jgi:hypothetical protein
MAHSLHKDIQPTGATISFSVVKSKTLRTLNTLKEEPDNSADWIHVVLLLQRARAVLTDVSRALGHENTLENEKDNGVNFIRVVNPLQRFIFDGVSRVLGHGKAFMVSVVTDRERTPDVLQPQSTGNGLMLKTPKKAPVTPEWVENAVTTSRFETVRPLAWLARELFDAGKTPFLYVRSVTISHVHLTTDSQLDIQSRTGRRFRQPAWLRVLTVVEG